MLAGVWVVQMPPPTRMANNRRAIVTSNMKQAKFNHLSFPSADVAGTVAFFENYVGCTVSTRGVVDSANYQWAVLKRGEFDIVIESSDRAVQWPSGFHIGLEVDTVAEVHALHAEFAAQGVEMVIGYQGSTGAVFNNTRGSRFFCRAPGSVMFEVHTREDIHDKWQGSFDTQRAAENKQQSA